MSKNPKKTLILLDLVIHVTDLTSDRNSYCQLVKLESSDYIVLA